MAVDTRMRRGIQLLLASAALVVGAGVAIAGFRSGTAPIGIVGAGVAAAGLTWFALVLALPRRGGR